MSARPYVVYADLLGVGDDVALNKDAKADQSWSLHDPLKAVDGTVDFWNAGDHGAHWLEVDLGQNYSLSHVDLSFPASAGGVQPPLLFISMQPPCNLRDELMFVSLSQHPLD